MSNKSVRSCVLAAAATVGMVAAVASAAPPPSGGMLPGEPQSPPATQPAAAGAAAPTSAPVAVNQDTPRGTLKVLTSAGANGDRTMFRKVIATTNPSEEKVVDAAANQAEATVKFQHALMAKFPPPGVSDPAAKAQADLRDQLASIDAFDEIITGDTAVVRPKDAPADSQGLTFKRINGKWMLPFEILSKGAPQDQLEKSVPLIDAQTQIYSSAADDVAAGKYKSIQDFQTDIHARMQKAMEEQIARQVGAGATTQPSTQPTAVGQK